MISALPDVKRVTLSPKDEFMILACDGIWNSLSSEEVVDFVRKRIQKGETKMSAICEDVSDTELKSNFKFNLFNKFVILISIDRFSSCSQRVWHRIHAAMEPDAIT